MRRDQWGRVVWLLSLVGQGARAPDEMERRLVEMGFIAGMGNFLVNRSV
ncbi:MAG: hypothetical protein KDK53_05780 [Maritimibacter sp.]|nr:hypothetical protein [Maritimibacter sp.]